jgi:hypothetical protein
MTGAPVGAMTMWVSTASRSPRIWE